MSAPSTLAVCAAPALDAGVAEFVRLCVGLVAGGGRVTLVEAGPGIGVLGADVERPPRVERFLESLAAFETVPRPVEAPELRTLLAAHPRLLRVAAPNRRGTPDVVTIDSAWLMHASDAALLLALEHAGQLVRA